FALNQAVRSANAAVRGESEGAPIGTDHTKLAIANYLSAMYPTGAAPAIDVTDPRHLPPSWQSGQNPALAAAMKNAFTTAVNRYCMQCHRLNALDFADYNNFSALAAQQGNQSVLERYINADLTDPQSLPMPQSELMFKNLQADSAAKQALQDW